MRLHNGNLISLNVFLSQTLLIVGFFFGNVVDSDQLLSTIAVARLLSDT